ncbi:isopentenyl-diphosphate Delta-isomerase [Pseudonocardia sp. TRM90224]|uniref:isopentenyl-diphosphate Delta-isomerase n=1 Tax=Pseudonocardia sp. TRM90224 TaxID=2812678 RepID=UPI001E37D40C|nr:isopentenyl-diphosphate Delta-isomerase [Pseudonocardia sp. TRM90224]
MPEQVVLLDEAGRATGSFPKASVHHTETPLHLAFSCYAFDDQDRLLFTQRALGKATWPGVWTNTCCGHPAPGEAMLTAIRRRLEDELGVEPLSVRLVLPRFRYRATMADGTVENELCPVFVARVAGEPDPRPDEVEAARWYPWGDFVADVSERRVDVSPWAQLQVAELSALGEAPEKWPSGDPADLPPAARLS